MSAKIVQAVNAMVSNSDKISDVVGGQQELLFMYKKKYVWGIADRSDEYGLWYYPDAKSTEELASLEPHEFEDMPLIYYSTKDIGTKEARDSFRELYQLVKEKVLGMDTVLDDIISDDAMKF